MSCFVFFFQAEDGIRDTSVTGVQTCALPICDLGVSEAEVSEMEKRLAARDLSFDPAPEPEDEEPYSPAAYLPAPDADPAAQEIGRASCRERVEISVVGVTLKKKRERRATVCR